MEKFIFYSDLNCVYILQSFKQTEMIKTFCSKIDKYVMQPFKKNPQLKIQYLWFELDGIWTVQLVGFDMCQHSSVSDKKGVVTGFCRHGGSPSPLGIGRRWTEREEQHVQTVSVCQQVIKDI